MQRLSIWIRESLKLLSGQRLHPLMAQCPICRQWVRLHANKAGRQHVLRHAQALYEGARLDVHRVSKVKCAGSKSVKVFDPRPGEQQRFRLPNSLLGMKVARPRSRTSILASPLGVRRGDQPSCFP
jgi:hypothetical protein